MASQPQAKKELCDVFGFLSLLINNNHFSLNFKEQAQISKRYRKFLQKIIISLGNSQAEVEGSATMNPVEKITWVDGKEEWVYFISPQSEVQIVIFKKLEKILRKNMLVFRFSFLNGPVPISLIILDYLLGRN